MGMRGLRFVLIASVPLQVFTPVVLGAASGGVVSWGLRVLPPFDTATRFIAVSAGGTHTVALKPDGTVAAWGQNCCGQTSVPADLSNVVSIATGYDHSLSLKSDGTVVAWGTDEQGQSTVPTGL